MTGGVIWVLRREGRKHTGRGSKSREEFIHKATFMYSNRYIIDIKRRYKRLHSCIRIYPEGPQPIIIDIKRRNMLFDIGNYLCIRIMISSRVMMDKQ